MEAAAGAFANMYDISKNNRLPSLEEACRLSAEVYIRMGAQFHSMGQSALARERLARARVLADEGRQGFASLSFYTGLVEEALGDIPAAITHLESFMQAATKVPYSFCLKLPIICNAHIIHLCSMLTDANHFPSGRIDAAYGLHGVGPQLSSHGRYRDGHAVLHASRGHG